MDAYNQFIALKTDEERWKWVCNNTGLKFTIHLDNDATCINFQCVPGDDDVYAEFDNYLGWSDGVVSLLRALDIDCECV